MAVYFESTRIAAALVLKGAPVRKTTIQRR